MVKKAESEISSHDVAKALTGRFQQIGSHPAREGHRRIIAAGAVMYRLNDNNEREYAIIHRPRYDDWSLPKGKLDPGESIPETAYREILEETGYRVRLGKLVGLVTYPVGSREKAVYYFTAEVLDGEFEPNQEVDELRWVSREEAFELLSYDVDQHVLRKAEKRLNLPDQTQMILVRHAHAFPRHTWAGNDNKRPLDKKGLKQAQRLPLMLAPFQPTAVYSALPDRCQQTAQPIAKHLGVDVTVDVIYGDQGWLESQKTAKQALNELTRGPGIPVVVSQGLAMPEYIAALSAAGTLPLDEIPCKKGGVWLLTFSEGALAGADYLASALPVK